MTAVAMKIATAKTAKMNKQTSFLFLSYAFNESITRPSGKFFPKTGLFQSNMVVPRAGFEPATTRSSAERSPRLSYLGAPCLGYHIKDEAWCFKVFWWLREMFEGIFGAY
jgi:hypothetical protein